MRAAVANAMGVVAPPDGSACYEVGGMWLPNRLSLLFSGSLLWTERRRTLLERMMRNFEADLGAGFEIAPLDLAPSPSRRMTRCFYASFLEHEAAARGVSGHATAAPRVLVPVFQARGMACAWREHGVRMAWAWRAHGVRMVRASGYYCTAHHPHVPFQAIHGATFHGVPGFTFEPDASGHGGCFRFEPP